MTREEYIDFANALKNNYTIDFNKLPEFCDMAISALSAEGEYIKKTDIFNELGDVNMDILTDEVKEIVNGLQTYTFPDSAENKGDLISRQAVLDTIGNVPDHNDGMVWEALSHAQRDVALLPSVENKCFEGMTNRKIISEFVERDDRFAIIVDVVNETVYIELSLDFWNAPYKAERGEADGK